jgi:hypothetical protein
MKKLFTILFFVLCVLFANAQFVNRGGGISNSNSGINPVVKSLNDNKAVGDTLLYCPAQYWSINATDAAGFTFQYEDLDGLTTNNAGYFMAFGVFYDTTLRVDWMMPWDTDTAFYFAATSWFTPAGQADNWLEFGPITLPAGSELSWYQRYNGSNGTPPYYFDGYEVLVSEIGMNNYANFLDPAIFTRADYTGTNGTDSSWILQTVTIPVTYANTPCYFAFHHNADDMDVLYLDEIKIIVTVTVGVDEEEGGISFVQNKPNPAKDQTVISYQLNNSANVSLQVNDITGREVFATNFGVQSAGDNQYTLNTSAFAPGIYVYTLMIDNSKIVKKMTIVK